MSTSQRRLRVFPASSSRTGILLAVCSSLALNGYANLSNTGFHSDLQLSALSTDLVTSPNLNAGTAVGSWTVTDDQESDLRVGSGTTALLADTGKYDFTANFYVTGILADNGMTVSLDTCMRRTDDASSNEDNLNRRRSSGSIRMGMKCLISAFR